jgi:hypothetical protein
MSELIWPPLGPVLERRVKSGDSLLLVISPFIKLDAFKELVEQLPDKTNLKVVVRWKPADLMAGVSDLGVYQYVKSCGGQLFVNDRIHLKLYVFASNVALHTSGNLTQAGMGRGVLSNIEVGSFLELNETDWAQIYKIIEESRSVDDSYCAQLCTELDRYIKENPKKQEAYFKSIDRPAKKPFSLTALPASPTPKDVRSFYFQSKTGFANEQIRRAIHDLVLYQIPPSVSEKTFDECLASQFKKSQFIKEFVSFLREKKSLRFGAVTEWIHDRCEDVPLPYRWQIKDSVKNLYAWLVFYFPEDIFWDTPNYSQVIHWQGRSAGPK